LRAVFLCVLRVGVRVGRSGGVGGMPSARMTVEWSGSGGRGRRGAGLGLGRFRSRVRHRHGSKKSDGGTSRSNAGQGEEHQLNFNRFRLAVYGRTERLLLTRCVYHLSPIAIAIAIAMDLQALRIGCRNAPTLRSTIGRAKEVTNLERDLVGCGVATGFKRGSIRKKRRTLRSQYQRVV
jgi:hypothetical protein